MPDDIHLQILPGPQIALTSRGARVASVPATPFTLPATPLGDAASLWQALPPPVQAALSALHDLQPDEPLPLWLDVQLPEAAAWRWELLVPPGKPATLAFSMATQTPLVRYVAAGAAAKPHPGVPRLLAVGASPRQQAPLEVAALLERLAARHDPRRLLVTTEPRCGPERLTELLREAPDMLVIVAHGAPGAVLLEDEYGDEVPLIAAELAALVKDTPVRAVVLAGCHGATPHGDAGATAETLLRAGMLGVIAMRGAVSTEASAAFLDGLLDAVSDGQPLEVAAAAGRRAILARCGEQSEWFVPVCWQRALHRSLTLAPPLLLRRGATRLADKAPSWAAQLASGGALGLLLASALAPLLPATGVTTSALVTLLGNLGLNVFSGYLGEALAKVWRRTGGGPEIATPDEVAAALQEIVQSQADAATHLADLAHASRATGVLVEAINRGVAGNTALLEGLQRDLAAHGAALGGLRADLHAGLAAVYQEQLGLRRVAEETRDLSRDANRKLDQLLGQAEAAERERLLGYLERIAPECNRLTFFAAESSDTSRAALTLDAIYVRLEVERAGEEARADREEQRRTALRALAERPRLVLLGSPGLGKSTFVNHVVRCLALAYLHPSEDWRAHLGDDWTHGALLPIRVLLRELAGYVMERQIRTADAALLWSHLGAKYDAEIAAALQRQARAGNALLLLDGLDEVQVNDDGWPLNVVRDSITMLPDALGRGSRILVTCRVLDYGDSPPRRLPGWPDERLAPLSDKLRLTFVERYYRALLALNRLDAARAAELQQGLARSIQTRRELARLAGNPLLLTMMAQVHTSEGELPGTRVQLYDLCVRWLMSRWNPRPGERPLGEQLGMREWNESNLYELMELIGHTAHLHGTFPDSESGADLSYGVLRDVVSSYFNPTADPARQAESDRRAAIFAGYISRASNGLLQVHAEPGARQAIYRFPHRTFQEYLAGRALICPARHDGEESAYGEGVSTTIRSHMLGLQTPGCAPVA